MFVNFVNIKQELLCYMQQNFASFGLSCFKVVESYVICQLSYVSLHFKSV